MSAMESVVSVRVVGPEVERAKLAATLLAYESLVARRVAGEGEKACTVGGDAWEDVGSRATLVLGETKYRGPRRATRCFSALALRAGGDAPTTGDRDIVDLVISTKYYETTVALPRPASDAVARGPVEALVCAVDAEWTRDVLEAKWAAMEGPNVQTRLAVASHMPEWLLLWAVDRSVEVVNADAVGSRVLEALEATMWSSIDAPKSVEAPERTPAAAPERTSEPAPSPAAAPAPPQEEEEDDDDDLGGIGGLGDIGDIIAAIHSGPRPEDLSDAQRRKRAADMALRLMDTLGISDDDDSD
ncbi:hypothetical protein SO694_00054245 [Aureococcus anophagefferens]|uniref:Uncharacterized protein n=1 Tax=Aureococcus anophagefferens TaxID=44056 RepID=A0ABR1FXR0_AURAN